MEDRSRGITLKEPWCAILPFLFIIHRVENGKSFAVINFKSSIPLQFISNVFRNSLYPSVLLGPQTDSWTINLQHQVSSDL